MLNNEVIIFSVIIVFQILYLVYIIKAVKELKETLERGKNKSGTSEK